MGSSPIYCSTLRNGQERFLPGLISQKTRVRIPVPLLIRSFWIEICGGSETDRAVETFSSLSLEAHNLQIQGSTP